MKKWVCGLYCRLSVEDNSAGESNSIQSQKIILNNYVSSLADAVCGKVYVDDGYSGSNFDRPDFKKMIADVEKGHINCVIVKDYSRFGRDYIDVGWYIEKYFPDKDVRFISVNDSHDSLNIENQSDLQMPIMNMFNDIYSRETSKKVRSGLKARKQQGKFIGAFAPYGYKKSSEDKNKLVIDENVAHIVKQIFNWRVEGYSTYAINNKLNVLNIPTPTQYKDSIGIKHNAANVKARKASSWEEATVRSILANEVYAGNIVQNKSTTRNHRTKKKKLLDESKWIRVENTHEAIVEMEMWTKVQSMVSKRTKISQKTGKLNIFAGVIRCADCGYTMAKTTNGHGGVGYTCTTHRSDKSLCSTHRISDSVLKESLFAAIMLQVRLAIDVAQILEVLKKSDAYDSKVKIYNNTIENLTKESELKVRLLKGLYFDLKKELITEDEYRELKSDLEVDLLKLENQLKEVEKDKPTDEFSKELTSIEVLSKFKDKKELTRDMVNELIDCIYINDDKSIRVDFKFADELDEVVKMIQ